MLGYNFRQLLYVQIDIKFFDQMEVFKTNTKKSIILKIE